MLSFAPDEAKLLDEIVSENSKINLKEDIAITSKVAKTIVDLYSCKVSNPNCIPLVVLKKNEHSLLYILVDLSNMCSKKFFQIVGKSHLICISEYWGGVYGKKPLPY